MPEKGRTYIHATGNTKKPVIVISLLICHHVRTMTFLININYMPSINKICSYQIISHRDIHSAWFGQLLAGYITSDSVCLATHEKETVSHRMHSIINFQSGLAKLSLLLHHLVDFISTSCFSKFQEL